MDFETWQGRLRSENTRKMYSKAFKSFLAYWRATPEQTLTWSADDAEERLIEWKEYLIREGAAGHTVLIDWAAVKRWFIDNRIRIVAKCDHVSTEKTYLDYIPSRQDVQALLDDCTLRIRLGVALMAFSGMRPADVVELQFRHVRKSVEAKDDVTTIVKQQRKTHQWYFTFLAPQGTRYLKAVLETRQRAGEVINDESYLLTKMGRPMTAYMLKCAIRWVIRRRFTKHPTNESFRLFRPYGFRKYFRRVVSKLGEDTAEFLMGHSSGLKSLTATYSGLKDMDEEAISALKQQYVALLPDLETELTELGLTARVKELEEREKEFKEMQQQQEAMSEELKRIDAILHRYEGKEE